MKPGEKVYYCYTGKGGTPIKSAAVVVARKDDGILVRVGRYDVHTNEVKTFESVVAEDLLEKRSVAWSFEAELAAGN